MPSPVPDLSVTRTKKAYEEGLPKGGIQFAKLFKPTFAKLRANKDNFRTWKAGLQMCIQASQPTHFTIDLWSFLTGKVSEEEADYKATFPVTYASESTQITGILKSALAAILDETFLIDLNDEDDLYDWLSQIQPPITALVGMKLCKELQLQSPENFTNILEYCEDMKSTYKKIKECEGEHIPEKNYLLQIMMGINATSMYAHEHDKLMELWKDGTLTYIKIYNALVLKCSSSTNHQARLTTTKEADSTKELMNQQIIALQAQVNELSNQNPRNNNNHNNSNNSRYQSRGRRGVKKCGVCHRPGHSTKEHGRCPRCKQTGHRAAVCPAPHPTLDGQQANIVTFVATTTGMNEEECPDLVDSSDEDSDEDSEYEYEDPPAQPVLHQVSTPVSSSTTLFLLQLNSLEPPTSDFSMAMRDRAPEWREACHRELKNMDDFPLEHPPLQYLWPAKRLKTLP